MEISLDGFVAGPNGEIDWLLRSVDQGAVAWIADTLWHASLHAMGSRTYYDMANYWPKSRDPLAAPMNEIPKAVFTRQKSLDLTTGPTTTALRDARRILATQGDSLSGELAPAAAS